MLYLMAVSVECDQIFRISLGVMEDNKHARSGHLVHNTVVHVNGEGGAFDRWCDHVRLSNGVFPGQDSAEVHELLPVLIRLGVGVRSRVTGIDSKIRAIAVACS